MLQLLIKGKIVDFKVSGGRPGQKKTSVLALEVRTWRQGQSGTQIYLVNFDEYWTDRVDKLDDKTKYLTVRCSDIVSTHEMDNKGEVHDYVWLKGEEFFL